MRHAIWKKTAAALLSGGMLLSQGGYVSAAEPEGYMQAEQESIQNTEGQQTETEQPAMALDKAGNLTVISETVLKMLEEGTVYLDEESGYVLDTEGGQRIDPQTGERMEEEEQPSSEESETTEEPSETPADSGTAENTDTSRTEETESVAESGEEKGEEEHSGREELIKKQQIVELPEVEEDFRFWTVARKYAFAEKELDILEKIPDGQEGTDTTEIRKAGKLKKGGLLYVLKEEDGWMYVESGNVRGFVSTSDVVQGEKAEKLLSLYQDKAKEEAKRRGQEYKGIEGAAVTAEALLDPSENEAYTYLRATVNQTLIDKVYAVTTADLLYIREEKNTDSRIIGTLAEGNLCYVLQEEEDGWLYIESGDVRGFIKKEYVQTGNTTAEQVEQNGEDSYATAEEWIKPEENKALYYTLTSVKAGVPGDEVRNSLLEFASQFIGNPYVWGGTSLTDGADCSGFVQSIYRQYGYELPRVAEDQAQYGTKIAVEDARPGDLIFYADETGYIYHVVLYAGEGKTIEAMGEEYGITQGTVDTKDAVWATQILDDASCTYGEEGIYNADVTEEMYGERLGEFEITYYCACELCCDKETKSTATGEPVVEGITIAADPSVIPYGTQVIINGHVFTAQDCGKVVEGNHIEIYVNSHQKALELGASQAELYLTK